MFAKLVGLLAGKFGTYAALAFILVAVGTCATQRVALTSMLKEARRDLSDTAKELTVANADLAQCRLNRDTLQDGIDAANARVQAERQAAEIRAAEGDKRLQAALKLAQGYKNRAARLAKAKPSSPDQCVAAQSLIVETLAEDRP